jgi:O-antigen/teichoic acid export membrane protein
LSEGNLATSYRKSAIDTIFVGAATLVQFLFGLFIMPLISKTMGAQGYGIWSQATATVSLILSVTNLGLGTALVRFLASEKSREEIREGFYSVIITLFAVNLIAALLVFVFAGPLADNFFNGAVLVVRLTGAMVILVTLVENCLLLIRTFQQVKMLSAFMAAETALFTALVAFFVFRGYGITWVVLAYISVKTLEFIVLFFLIRSKIGLKWPRFSRLREFLSFGLPLAPRGLAYWLININDRYIISYVLGATSLGIYAAGYNLGNIPYSVTTILSFVLMATLPQLYDQGRIDEVKTHLRFNLKYFLAIAIPFLFGAAVLGESVLRLFSTQEIAAGGHFVTPLVALAVTLLGVHNIMWNILLLVKKTRVLVIIWGIAAALNVGLNLLLVPSVGIIGAPVSALVAYALALGAVSYYARKELTFPIDWSFILKSIAASLVMSAAVWPLRSTSLLGTFFTVLAGVAVYGVVLVLLRGFSRSEFKFFWGLLKRTT